MRFAKQHKQHKHHVGSKMATKGRAVHLGETIVSCLLACLLACVIVRLQSRRTPAIKKGWDGTTIVGLHFSGRSSFFFFVDSDWPITRLAEEAFGAWTVRVDLDDAPKSCVLSLSQTPRTKMGTETKTTAMFVLERGKPFGRVPQRAPTLRHRRHEQSAYAEAPSGTHRQERTVRNAPSGTHRQERTVRNAPSGTHAAVHGVALGHGMRSI
jgi:hypothetical protein